MERSQKVQNTAARTVTYDCQEGALTPVLYSLAGCQLNKKLIFKLLLLTYKALNDFAPKYLSGLVDIYVPERNLRSAQSQQLVQPAYNLRTHGFSALFMRFSFFMEFSVSRN